MQMILPRQCPMHDRLAKDMAPLVHALDKLATNGNHGQKQIHRANNLACVAYARGKASKQMTTAGDTE